MAKIQIRLTELYACYTYLNTGYGIWVKGAQHLPSKLKKELIDTIGLEYLNEPCFSVQFHPEACAGPKDTSFLFDNFISMLT